MTDAERIEREVIERIKRDAPHADPVIVAALLARLRATLLALALASLPGCVSVRIDAGDEPARCVNVHAAAWLGTTFGAKAPEAAKE